MIPQKPFDTYKWRWLMVQPSEGLLDPPVFLGVLRVLARHEGEPPASPQVAQELGKVQADTGTAIDLVRTPDRNLVRNSGQYWKGTGLLAPIDGELRLTTLGRRVASGQLTQAEFAAITVQQAILPNPWTYPDAETARWNAAGLKIRPLALILEVMETLGTANGAKASYLTTRELTRIGVPLAGAKVLGPEIAENVSLHRRNKLDVSEWPDCTPKSNDRRMAREFLLFLANFGLCRRVPTASNLDERFYLDEAFDLASIAEPQSSIFGGDAAMDAVLIEVQHSPLPSVIERRRIATMVLARPQQAKFRAGILKAYEGRCFLTAENVPEVLEAAHIVPVQHNGMDETNNGLCLRIDVHRLFDSGNLRLKPDGKVVLSDTVASSKGYSSLPNKVTFPAFVNPANLRWRDSYW